MKKPITEEMLTKAECEIAATAADVFPKGYCQHFIANGFR